jgi:hypothetical protein
MMLVAGSNCVSLPSPLGNATVTVARDEQEPRGAAPLSSVSRHLSVFAAVHVLFAFAGGFVVARGLHDCPRVCHTIVCCVVVL